ncbi:hypothetical protein [Gaetbulibacter aestuarii]|uniref:Uncharacterized protein n=1 Tax=Gaetbulibacter aestuarii TaxID=1502358 RepID=A0ABW7MVI8_9FLAO
MKLIILFAILFLSLQVNSQIENDCVFNNDFEGLTMEWLQELNQTHFIWNEIEQVAEKTVGEDSIKVSKGGCVHFGTEVEFVFGNNNNALDNTDYWLKKAIEIAKAFDLKWYEEALKSNNFKRFRPEKNQLVFDINDDDISDNLFYEGVIISKENNMNKMSLSKYMN